MKVRSEEDAIAVADHLCGPVPQGDRVVARRVRDSSIFSVCAIDQRGRGYIGVNLLVGPDGRVWRFSSNPGIHDPGVVESVLCELYESDDRGAADQQAVRGRVERITRQQAGEVRQHIDDDPGG